MARLHSRTFKSGPIGGEGQRVWQREREKMVI